MSKFYDELMNVYDEVFPLMPPKVAWLHAIIANAGYRSMFDIGCATGTLAQRVADQLELVNGFDLNEAMVKKAQSANQHTNVVYEVGNMTVLETVFPGASYDLVTCFGNTLVHIEPEQLDKVITQIYARLKPGGMFAGQLINYDHVFAHNIHELPLIDNDAVRFERRYRWKDEKVIKFATMLEIKATGESFSNSIELYPIRQEHLGALLKKAGFKEVRWYRDYQGNPVTNDHLPLIFTAIK